MTATAAAVLLLVGLPWTMRGASALPGPLSAPFRPRSGLAEGVLPVRWASACSPRLALLRRHQDAMLQCELYAPAGTDLTWLKDGQQHLPKTPTAPPSPAAAPYAVPRQARQCRRDARKEPRPSTRSALLHISTGTYIDCASPAHQGHYTLRVTTPNRHVYTRNFSVVLTSESASPANTCYLGPEFVTQIPRVWFYVRRARGTTGGSLVLPCRVLDQGMTTVWHFRGARLLPGLINYKYEVLASGDLVVQCLEPGDAGLYTCTAYNTVKPYLFDRVHTWLTMPKGAPAMDQDRPE
ncbi:uncharacterized protein LOC126988116 [Eriocheir sinensis]|uniref:uncharacterized protein LOC126988116 n=1 Tax=Eriocheir sinensis TaxID=95602 RepID=UPI0021C9CF60|nr:uncharacterized protein LOC126988116 [Eriocheir sinensis]